MHEESPPLHMVLQALKTLLSRSVMVCFCRLQVLKTLLCTDVVMLLQEGDEAACGMVETGIAWSECAGKNLSDSKHWAIHIFEGLLIISYVGTILWECVSLSTGPNSEAATDQPVACSSVAGSVQRFLEKWSGL